MKSRLFSRAVFAVCVFLISLEILLRAVSLVVPLYLIEMWFYGSNHKQYEADVRGHSHRPNTSSTVMGQRVTINKLGYRNSGSINSKKMNIFVAGDSVTFGFGVGDGEAFVSLLNKKSARHFFINGGVGNYNYSQINGAVLHAAKNLELNEVWIILFSNDFEDKQVRNLNFLNNSLLYSVVTQIFNSTSRTYYESNLSGFEKNFLSWSSEAQEIISFLKKKKVRVRYLLVPDLRDLREQRFVSIEKRVELFLDDNGISFCNARLGLKQEVIRSGLDLWVSKDDPHPNKMAHMRIALEVEKCWKENF